MEFDTLLEVIDLRLAKQNKPVLDGVSFGLHPGRFYGLLGPNGAGKSSLLRILYRAERATSGTVRLGGKDIETIARRHYAAQVGALVQEQVSLAGLSLREVVQLGVLPLRLSTREASSRVDQALGDVGLLDRAEDDAARLSGGEQQRVFFAQILALDPALYLLDEPHNHLDLHFQYRLLDEVRQRGGTVLASFHDISLAARYCDEVLLLDQGRLVDMGPPEAVLTRERFVQIYRVNGELNSGRLAISGAV